MINRLHAICPYFAMFPESFVEQQISAYTVQGDLVYDPFSGRGTTALQALLTDRQAIASDINPVAFCVTGAKAQVPSLQSVLAGLRDLESQYIEESQAHENERQALPAFFRRAFYHATLRQLLFLRKRLQWYNDPVNRFIAALVLGSLHGEMDSSSSYFSNQMPRTVSTKPAYSLKYWRRNHLWPKKRDVFGILRSRAGFRLSGDIPSRQGLVAMCDVRKAAEAFPTLRSRVKAVITSPPYYNVTNYEEDQWLRLWFLGNDPYPTYGRISKDDRHTNKEQYWTFLAESWAGIRPLLKTDAVICCRMGGKDMDEPEITRGLWSTIVSSFPDAALVEPPKQSMIQNKQTGAFRPKTSGCRFEIDYVFRISNNTVLVK